MLQINKLHTSDRHNSKKKTQNLSTRTMFTTKTVSPRFFTVPQRQMDYQGAAVDILGTLINEKIKGATTTGAIVKAITKEGIEPKTAVDIIKTALPRYVDTREAFTKELQKLGYHEESTKTKVEGLKSLASPLFASELYLFNSYNSDNAGFIKDKTMHHSKENPFPLSQKHTGQKNCDGSFKYRITNLKTKKNCYIEQGVDIKYGMPKFDNHCTLTPLIFDAENQKLFGIINDPLELPLFFDKQRIQLNNTIDRYALKTNEQLRPLIFAIDEAFRQDMPFQTKTALITQCSFQFAGTLNQINPNISVNTPLYVIFNHQPLHKPDINILRAYPPQFFDKADTRAMLLARIVEEYPYLKNEIIKVEKSTDLKLTLTPYFETKTLDHFTTF